MKIPMPKELMNIVNQLNDSYGQGTVLLGNDMRFQSIPRMSSGVYELDVALGGGWPRGRLVQISGPESSGKSYLAYLAAKTASKYCHWCAMLLDRCTCGAKDPIATAWVDVESTHDAVWASKIGVNLDLFYVIKPEHGAAAVDQIDMLIRSGQIGLVVLDSIAAMVPAEQLEKSAEDGMSPGALARMMSLGTKKWQSALNTKLPHPTQRVSSTSDGKKKSSPVMWDNLCTLICLNQLRESISRVPLPPSPPGGRAARHAWSVHLALSFASKDMEWDGMEGDEQSATAQTVHFITQKNKTFSPRKAGMFTIDFKDASVDNDVQVIRMARRFGIVDESGTWLSYGEHRAQGEAKFAEMCKSNGLLKKIRVDFEKKYSEELASPVKRASHQKETEDAVPQDDVPKKRGRKRVAKRK